MISSREYPFVTAPIFTEVWKDYYARFITLLIITPSIDSLKKSFYFITDKSENTMLPKTMIMISMSEK